MRRCVGRGVQIATLVLSLAACGGGGGADSSSVAPGGSNPTSNDIGARVFPTSLSIERDIHERSDAVPLQLKLQVDLVPAYYRVVNTSKVVTAISESGQGLRSVDLQVNLWGSAAIGAGTHEDTITIEVCLDPTCARPATGSPFVVPVKMTVGFFAPTEAGVPTQSQSAVQTLEHDLVAAVYSVSRDTLVMASKTPTPALHVYDLAAGSRRSVALTATPTAVAISPDGLQAAVGHDAAVSLVDLGTTPTVRRFPVAAVVGAVVIDATGRIFAFEGAPSSSRPVHWVDPAVGTAMSSSQRVFGNSLPVLHPTGDRIYFATRDVSPNDVVRVSLDTNGVAAVTDSPYHGDYEVCGQVWTGMSGARLYTACGNIFNASSDPSLDMRYAGSFALSPRADSMPFGYVATAVNDSPASDRLVVLEQDKYACDPRVDRLIRCFTRVATYSASTLNLQSRNALAPITAGSDRFAQIGRYVFHRPDGRVVLLSELRGAPAAAAIRLSTLP